MSLLDTLLGMYDTGTQQLNLNMTALGAWTAPLAQSSGSGAWQFSGVAQSPSEQAGTITFAASGLKLTGTTPLILFPAQQFSSIQCAIYNADTSPVFVISAFTSSNWNLANSFPGLQGTFWEDLAVKTDDASRLPRLLLASGTVVEPSLNRSLSAGVSFFAVFDETQGLFAPASWIVGPAPVGFGAIVPAAGLGTSLDVGLEISTSTNGFPGIFNNLQIPLAASLSFDPADQDATPGLSFSAQLSWGGQQQTLSAVLPSESGGTVEIGLTGQLALPGQAELADYFGGTSITSYLPDPFKNAMNSICISGLYLGVGLGSKKLEYAKVTISALTDTSLDIIADYIEVENIAVSVTVNDPFGSPSAAYRMTGGLDIGGVELDVAADLVPTIMSQVLSVSVDLAQGEQLNLTAIAEKFGLPSGAPSVMLTEFHMGGSTDGTFYVGASLEEIPTGSGQQAFVLSDLIFELDYSSQAEPATTFSMTGSMTIAGVDAVLSLTAGNGWEIQGETGTDTPIPIGTLIEDFGNRYGLTFPNPVSSLELHNVAFTYTKTAGAAQGSFSFSCEGTFTIDTAPVSVAVTIDMEPDATGNGYHSTFGGTITIGSLTFALIFDTGNMQSDIFAATFSASGDSPSSISIYELVYALSPEAASVVPQDLEVGLKDVKFIYYKDASGSKYALGLDLSASFSLSDLPLIGSDMSGTDAFKVNDLQFLYASQPFAAAEAGAVNALLPQGVFPLPSAGFGSGMTVGTELQWGGQTQTFMLAMGSTSATRTPAKRSYGAVGSVSDSTTSASAQWLSIQRSFGPVALNRIGVSYQNGLLWFLLDGSLSAFGLTITLNGMGFGSPLSAFEPQFSLLGLGFDLKEGPLEIGGAFSEVSPAPDGTAFSYEGGVVIETESFSIEGIGSYAQLTDGQPSMFVFATASAALGGPPALFMTGLSAGFGYNSSMAMPAPEQVADFPLMALAGGGTPPPLLGLLAELDGTADYAPGKRQAWIVPSRGDSWLAAGISFQSFGLIQSQALLLGKFGSDLEFALLGTSMLRLPKSGDTVYAQAELELQAIWKPSSGFFGLTALLTPDSFVLDPSCHLTGGFAFYLWYDGPNAGQFVATLGGYHPAFQPPSYYPSVPRLGINWALSDQFQIEGDAYFAITPGSIMTGGALKALYHDGNLKAWFTANADLLITFNPFSFQADISVSIGASYRINLLFTSKTISAELGASLELWGPPTGGKARVHWWIISFTIDFGADASAAQSDPLAWEQFKPLLPALDSVVTIKAAGGLAQSPAAGTNGSGSKLDDSDLGWLVRAGTFSFITQTAFPASHYAAGSSLAAIPDPAYPNGYSVQVRPMNTTDVSALHQIVIEQGGSEIDLSSWTLAPYGSNLPSALWGEPLKDAAGQFVLNPQVPNADTVANVPSGLAVSPPQTELGASRSALSGELLAFEDLSPQGEMPLALSAQAEPLYVPVFAEDTPDSIAAIMGTAMQNRNSIYEVLSGLQIYTGSNGSLAGLASQADSLYCDSPLQVAAAGRSRRDG
ncbi:DUF6603 domain-containing protein [Paenibacillus lutrae]|uniref:DUF6603 domain-containing protein n=1 Tax=Paenibacillus lutrae TaxID=2078573 RepID=A0A7X3FHQ1_9BACL|nr:DUF6603 domain-containing protein [Paenibacillus lutrae]MVO99862.1 hypothetical protein [Paenibacillus lutrae]